MKRKRYQKMESNLLLAMIFVCLCIPVTHSLRAGEPEIVSVKKIWDGGEHNAFTDLIGFRGGWWCTFREAKDHGPSVGKVRVILSDDGDDWTSVKAAGGN